MSCVHILRRIAVAFILATMLVVLPATQALAASISASPSHGKIADDISLTGSGYTAGSGTPVTIYFSGTANGTIIGTDVLDQRTVRTTTVASDNTISTNFFVPSQLGNGAAVSGGTYYLYAVYSGNVTVIASISFTVDNSARITLDQASGPVGTSLQITGTFFGASEAFTLTFDDRTLIIQSGDRTTTAAGSFISTVAIPESTAGSHTITVTGSTSASTASASVTTTPKITASPAALAAGDNITVNGSGFAPSSSVTVNFGGISVLTTQITDSRGSFTALFAAPSQGAGARIVDAIDASLNVASASVTIAPAAMSIDVNSGFVSSTTTVSGTGFLPGVPITITFDNAIIKNATSSAVGKFAQLITIPAKASGIYKIRATDGASTLSADYTITTTATINPVTSATAPAFVGTNISVTGIGFLPGRTVQVDYDGTQVTTTTAATDGSFTATFSVPSSKGGTHVVTVSDGTNNKQFSVFMDSTAPASPTLTNPATGVRQKAQPSFTWTAVTDPSGITYTLEIATSQDFSAGSIILQKTGITATGYALSDTEKLGSVSSKTPYFWRVAAIDGASNQSPWSSAGSFPVGFILETSTIIYVLLGFTAVILGLFGYWLGHRSASSRDDVT